MSQTPEFFGKYILLEKLASGGMAEVYLAKNQGAENVSKFLAIKRILPQFSGSQEFIEMFKEEAKIAINLHNANIVTINEFDTQNNQFFIVMEYVEGLNLRQSTNRMMKTSHYFKHEHIVYIINEVARGLDHAHRCVDNSTGKPLHIIHRDISPQNIMLNYEGEVKICDFGIAKAESKIESTQAGTLKGKFGYMSPEQAEGLEVDARTDLFSLGIVLWELLAKDRLFQANNEVNTLRKIKECQIPSLRKMDPNFPQELERIVNKCLAKDRSLRYQTASEFHKDLQRFLNRQFPDFSSHDFSNFIKQVFAKERAEARGKLVEYSKLQMQVPVGHEKTQFLANTTTQSISAHTTTQPLAPPVPEERLSFRELVAKEPDNSKGHFSISGMAEVKLTPPPLPHENKGVETRPKPNYVAEPSIGRTMTGTGTNYRQSTIDYELDETSSNGYFTAIMALLFVIGFGFLGFMYLRNNPSKLPAAVPYVTKLDAWVNKLIDGSGSNGTPNGGTESTQIGSNSPKNNIKIYVNTVPEGADIYLNGTKLTRQTPAQLEVKPNTPMKLELDRIGYEHKVIQTTPQDRESFEFEMKKVDIGYLNVEVRSAIGEVEIRLNGLLLQNHPPIYRYPYPAGGKAEVTAFDPVTRFTASQKVTVRKDLQENIVLILKKDDARSRDRDVSSSKN